MSNLTFFKLDNLGPGRESAPLPERLLEGDPRFANWDVEQTADGKLRTGVWEITPGTIRSIKGGVWEYCHILSGVSELIEDGKEPIRIQAGDNFVMKPDYVGKWRCIETTRKIWIIYGNA
ncbi:cupin domain-containing protein [Polaromonas sp. LjRoot131]|uniref:cupin domain-containing protein n=1 Tax=Polaromonas sp. LjRoot131 TaxID=3342262 RepID=UPI003ECE523E